MYIYAKKCICMYMNILIYIYIFKCIYLYIWIYINMYIIFIYIYICIYKYIFIFTFMHMYIYIYTYACIYIYIITMYMYYLPGRGCHHVTNSLRHLYGLHFWLSEALMSDLVQGSRNKSRWSLPGSTPVLAACINVCMYGWMDACTHTHPFTHSQTFFHFQTNPSRGILDAMYLIRYTGHWCPGLYRNIDSIPWKSSHLKDDHSWFLNPIEKGYIYQKL